MLLTHGYFTCKCKICNTRFRTDERLSWSGLTCCDKGKWTCAQCLETRLIIFNGSARCKYCLISTRVSIIPY